MQRSRREFDRILPPQDPSVAEAVPETAAPSSAEQRVPETDASSTGQAVAASSASGVVETPRYADYVDEPPWPRVPHFRGAEVAAFLRAAARKDLEEETVQALRALDAVSGSVVRRPCLGHF